MPSSELHSFKRMPEPQKVSSDGPEQQTLVSVVIPCRNGERYLPEAIHSVLAQSYQHFEIILIDNGSTDSTRAVAAGYPTVRYFYQPNQGAPAARNRGLAESRGEYVVFLDHDDRLHPQALELAVSHLDHHPDCAIVFGFYQLIDSAGCLMAKQDPHVAVEQACYQTVLKGLVMPPGTCMFRRWMLASVGGFNPSLTASDDYDLYLRVSRSYAIYCHNQVVLDYRRHEGNMTARVGIRHSLESLWNRLDEQQPYILGNPAYEVAYKIGKRNWCKLLGVHLPYEITAHLKAGHWVTAIGLCWFMLIHYPNGFLQYASTTCTRISSHFKQRSFSERST